MLEARNLECIRADRRLFRDLSLQLNAGELLHVQGQNGSGKSTLLRILSSLFEPTQGDVRWNAVAISKLREEFSRELLYIGHKPGIKEELTGLENLRIAATLNGDPVSEGRAIEALEQMGLRGFDDLPCKQLSQGQKRRVALSRLLLSRARLWILDEPFTALDSAVIEVLQGVISSHLSTGGMVILTTHQEVAVTQGDTRQLQLGDGETSDV